MDIKVTKLPMTVDAVRQEVIKVQMNKMIKKYKQKYMNFGYCFIAIAFIFFFIAIIVSNNHYPTSIIRIPLIIFMIIGISSIIFAIRGSAERECRIENGTKNYGIPEQEMGQRMIDYMENILDLMNSELEDLDKKAQKDQKEIDETSDAYYEVYIAYTKLIIQIDPQYFSSMEGGDPYRN